MMLTLAAAMLFGFQTHVASTNFVISRKSWRLMRLYFLRRNRGGPRTREQSAPSRKRSNKRQKDMKLSQQLFLENVFVPTKQIKTGNNAGGGVWV